MFRKILLPIDVAEPEIAKEAIDVAVGVAKAGKRSANSRMAVIYGGLWAGATSFISAIASSTAGVTRCTPVIVPP